MRRIDQRFSQQHSVVGLSWYREFQTTHPYGFPLCATVRGLPSPLSFPLRPEVEDEVEAQSTGVEGIGIRGVHSGHIQCLENEVTPI
ncbi:acyltransferase [Sesbania bispinosa]|nr:acyltransferase [Sesbania bispinosa]